MEQLLISPYLLAFVFFGVAIIYSSVGLGGGTSYTAFLAVFGASHRAIPPISLTMNMIVASLATVQYLRQGHGRPKLILALLIPSVPMAYVGASIPIEERIFYPVLIVVLLLVGARILFWSKVKLELDWTGRSRLAVIVLFGMSLGFVSGMVGIGGGIFLVPMLVILGLADAKEAAACGALFVLVNSMAGLGGHLQRYALDWSTVLPLMIAVGGGGLVGGYLGAAQWRKKTVRTVMAVVVLVAAFLLLINGWRGA